MAKSFVCINFDISQKMIDPNPSSYWLQISYVSFYPTENVKSWHFRNFALVKILYISLQKVFLWTSYTQKDDSCLKTVPKFKIIRFFRLVWKNGFICIYYYICSLQNNTIFMKFFSWKWLIHIKKSQSIIYLMNSFFCLFVINDD